MMASQHDEMFYDSIQFGPISNNSPRYTGNGLNRQPSRQFMYSAQAAAPFTPEEFMPFNTPGSERHHPGPVYVSQPWATYDNTPSWNYNSTTSNAGTMGPSSRARPSARRAALPSTWMEPQQHSQYSPMPNSQRNGIANGLTNNQYSQGLTRPGRHGSDEPEELIPTAIVIKNIPFAVKKEKLVEKMSDMHLPLPYAFNYHFDNGVFRGLAFANYSSPEETSVVIDQMNGMDMEGRKLRVEYKKMLPLEERERIEREKRERRGQLEEQHRPLQTLALHNAPSMSSLSSAHPAASPSPVSMRSGAQEVVARPNIDMNDRQTLDCYARLLIFKEDKTQSYINYGPPLSGSFRKVVHELAQHLGLHHMSVGSGEDRHVHISKEKLESRSQYPVYSNDSNRRGLARAATMDFNDARESGYHGLRPQNSARLDVPSSPSLGGLGGQRSLREAKSFGDLQARTASPALSSSSFPAALLNNVRAYPEYSMMNGTPASNTWDESALNSSIANLNLGFGGHASNPRLNGRNGMNSDSHNTNAGAIGSQRGVTGHAGSYDDAPRNGASAVPAERQPRGPPHDWGSGFARPRQNANPSRGFGDLDNHEPDQASDHDNSRFM